MANNKVKRQHQRLSTKGAEVLETVKASSHQAILHNFIDIVERIGKSKNANSIQPSVARDLYYNELYSNLNSLLKLHTISELAQLAKVSETTIKRYINVSRLPSSIKDTIIIDKVNYKKPTISLSHASYLSNAVKYASNSELKMLHDDHILCTPNEYQSKIAEFNRNKKNSITLFDN